MKKSGFIQRQLLPSSKHQTNMTLSVLKLTVILAYLSIVCYAILHRKRVLNATERHATCNDGTDAVFYIQTTRATKWVIFLESGGLCFDYSSCLDRSNQEPYLTGTNSYPSEIIGGDILSADAQKNFAHDFNKVLIPYCSSDLWIGNTTKSMHSLNNSLVISFRGYQIFRAVVEDLDKYGLDVATEILLAGSSAGGIGVLNQVKYMKRRYNARISLLVDSSWFVNYNNMLSERRVGDFIEDINASGSCMDRAFGYPCCLSAFCMIARKHIPEDAGILAVISRHDIYAISKGIITTDQPVNQTATTGLISDMLSFSGEITHSVRLLRTFRNFHGIVTSCLQHTYIAASSLWSPGELFYPRSQTLLRFPLFVFQHSVSKEMLNRVLIKRKSIRQIVANWYETLISMDAVSHTRGGNVSKFDEISLTRENNSSDYDQIVLDPCRGVNCNPTCPKSIIFRSQTTRWPIWLQCTFLVLYLLSTTACLFIKVFWTVKRIRESRKQTEFVSSLYSEANLPNAIGLPCCIPSNFIGLSCLDVKYSVLNEKQSRLTNQPQELVTPVKSRFRGLGHQSGSVTAEKRSILKGVSAYFNPGQLIAVMGPSGSGKTTFLDILTGRKNADDFKTNVFINGMTNTETHEWFKRHSGYVLQLAKPYHEELTVRENLTFSALMRLPRTMSTKNKLWRVEQVIGQAGLNDYADVIVGSATGPGLSGGQKRRLCVAIQLLRVPSVLFLDEPTSGLDSASSLELLETLHGLTLSGRLVILSIHQPRIEIFHMFDRILFLCDGKVAFFGSPLMAPTMIAEALKNTGKVCNASNPADTIMDVLINEKSQELIVDFYNKSGEIEAIKEGIVKASNNPIQTLSMKVKRFSSSLADRLLAFDCRASKCQTCGQKLYLLFIFLLYGIALGSVYLQTDSAVLLMSCYQVFTCASQLFMASVIHSHFNKAMPVFSLEQAEGVGKSYELIIHSFIRIAAMSFIPLLLCSAIIYLCTVVRLDLWTFFVTTVIHVQLNHVWIALIMIFASIFPRYSTLICPMLSAVSGFAGGFLVPKPKMPGLYYWLFYVNPTHWAYSGIMKMLIGDVMFGCESGSVLDCQANMGIVVLKQFGLNKVEPFLNMVILLAMLFVLLCLSMLLMEMKHARKFLLMKIAVRNIACCLFEGFSNSPSCCKRSKRHKEEDHQILLNKKDIEANGNFSSPITFESENLELLELRESTNGITKDTGNPETQAKEDVISAMMPIQVQPMLTGRSVQKSRPNTISVFSEEESKHSLVSRSSTFTGSERPARFKTLKQKQKTPVRNAMKDIQDFGRPSREGSLDSPEFLSRYLDVVLRPHEVYCSLSTDRTRKTRRKSVNRRMPDDLKRSESVYIQRKASMLLLAEKRKSMTAQITGFSQVLAYAGEISDQPKKSAGLRKNAISGVKRKIETKKHQKEAMLTVKSESMDLILDSDGDLLRQDFARPVARRSLVRSPKAFDYADEDDDKERAEISVHEPRVQYNKPSVTVSSKCRRSGQYECKQTTGQSKSQSIILSDGKPTKSPNPSGVFVIPKIIVNDYSVCNPHWQIKPDNNENRELLEQNDSDSRSTTCQSSLGSINELDEVENNNITDDDDIEMSNPKKTIHHNSMQNIESDTWFSENSSESTSLVTQDSLEENPLKSPPDVSEKERV